MKSGKIIAIAVAVCAAAAFAAEIISGDYNTTLGYLAGQNASGNRVTAMGAGAAGESSEVETTAFFGAASGTYSSYVYNSVGFGYRSLREAYDIHDSIFLGNNAGSMANGCYYSAFIGAYAGETASNCTNFFAFGMYAGNGASCCSDCVFIGFDSGMGANGKSWCVDINGQFGIDRQARMFYITPDPNAAGENAPVYYRDGELHIKANSIAVESDVGYEEFYTQDAAQYLDDDGSDANNGTSPSTPVRTIGQALFNIDILVRDGQIPSNKPPVVLVAPGKYESEIFTVTSRLNPRQIVFKSAGGKKSTFLVPKYTGEFDEDGTTPLFYTLLCEAGYVTFDGFTLTKFNGVPDGLKVYESFDSHSNGAVVSYRIKLQNCDICRNKTITNKSFLCCDLENCDIYDNECPGRSGYAGWVTFGTMGAENTMTFRNCRVYDNIFVFTRLIRHSRTENCLFRTDFYYSTQAGASNCTIIANHFQNKHISGLSSRGASLVSSRNFIVCPDFNLCSTAEPYQTNDVCVVCPSANLTADYIAADENCPTVCDNGLPDFGYKSSLFGVLKTARKILAQIEELRGGSGGGAAEGNNAPMLMSAPPNRTEEEEDDEEPQQLPVIMHGH